MAIFICLDMVRCSFLTLVLAESLRPCGLLTGYIRRCFGYMWQIALGLLHRRGWATVVVVVRHMLLTLVCLLALIQQLPAA
jgi:hypothetical protein